jgi:hypothetical protein
VLQRLLLNTQMSGSTILRELLAVVEGASNYDDLIGGLLYKLHMYL